MRKILIIFVSVCTILMCYGFCIAPECMPAPTLVPLAMESLDLKAVVTTNYPTIAGYLGDLKAEGSSCVKVRYKSEQRWYDGGSFLKNYVVDVYTDTVVNCGDDQPHFLKIYYINNSNLKINNGHRVSETCKVNFTPDKKIVYDHCNTLFHIKGKVDTRVRFLVKVLDT